MYDSLELNNSMIYHRNYYNDYPQEYHSNEEYNNFHLFECDLFDCYQCNLIYETEEEHIEHITNENNIHSEKEHLNEISHLLYINMIVEEEELTVNEFERLIEFNILEFNMEELRFANYYVEHEFDYIHSYGIICVSLEEAKPLYNYLQQFNFMLSDDIMEYNNYINYLADININDPAFIQREEFIDNNIYDRAYLVLLYEEGIKNVDILNKIYSYIEEHIEFLMVRHENSMNFIDIISGEYTSENEFINELEFITNEELNLIEENPIENIIEEHYYASELELIEEIILEYNSMLESGALEEVEETDFDFPEWSLPEGRENTSDESDIECAYREFEEETYFSESHVLQINNVEPLEESFIGTDGIEYEYTYFMSIINTEESPEEFIINDEIGEISWLSYRDMKEELRYYQEEELNIINQFMSYLSLFIYYNNEHSLFEELDVLFSN